MRHRSRSAAVLVALALLAACLPRPADANDCSVAFTHEAFVSAGHPIAYYVRANQASWSSPIFVSPAPRRTASLRVAD